MKRKLISLFVAFAMVLLTIPAFNVSAEVGTDIVGTGQLELDTDPTGGYEGDYVVIYNPSTSSYSTFNTGDMTGRIETEIDPYCNVSRGESASDELIRIDVDSMIAEQNAGMEKPELPEAEKTSYNVGDVHNFSISSYSPGPSTLSFRCVAKGDHCYVWTPSQNLPNYYPIDAMDPTFAQQVSDEFDSNYALMNSSFGDHNNGSQGDGRVHLMYYNIDDGFQPGVSTSYVAGYFSSMDFYYNGLPMIHLDTYPGVYYVNAEGEESYRLERTFNTFCHEYQHLINYSQTGGMDTWLNECMSAAAEEICYPGSSVVSRIQSWEQYYFADNDDWLCPPHEFAYEPNCEIHNGYSMYDWSNGLNYILPLYSQVSFFSQYLFTHYGNSIFRTITQNYANNGGDDISAISTATGANTSTLVKNFRIALTANDYSSFDGLYGFMPQESYDPSAYHDVENPYDLLGPVVFTGTSCSIAAGGAITVKPVGGVYNPPSGANSGLVYIGIRRNIYSEPVPLDGITITPNDAEAFVGHETNLRIVRDPVNANDYTAVWTSSNPDVASVAGGNYSAVVTGVSAGIATITCIATNNQSGRSYTATATVTVRPYPTLDDALNVSGGTLHFTSTGEYPWEINFEQPGRTCASSGNVNVSDSTSSVVTTVQMEAGETLTFEWSVSSESNYDKLKFFVNSTERTNISGNVGFTSYTYTAATSGSYTFMWSYQKDYSVNSGRDCGYLDNVVYSGDPGTGVIPGDANLDGIVDVTDALIAMRAALGIIQLNEQQQAACDINGDGNIDITDVLLILRMAMNII